VLHSRVHAGLAAALAQSALPLTLGFFTFHARERKGSAERIAAWTLSSGVSDTWRGGVGRGGGVRAGRASAWAPRGAKREKSGGRRWRRALPQTRWRPTLKALPWGFSGPVGMGSALTSVITRSRPPGDVAGDGWVAAVGRVSAGVWRLRRRAAARAYRLLGAPTPSRGTAPSIAQRRPRPSGAPSWQSMAGSRRTQKRCWWLVATTPRATSRPYGTLPGFGGGRGRGHARGLA
jgi:hypothetical protein